MVHCGALGNYLICLCQALILMRKMHTKQQDSSGVFVVVVEVYAKEEILQMRLVASVHQLGHH